ncbi:MAG: FAD-binding oxidoreductase [Streptosporangiales bacterium]|nr:FAD-binding oxidoreductase [Streptosporangiales bacterium]
MRAIVVGAGVLGLSCAARLLQAGYEVDVVARDLPPETTSMVAAALWYPYLAAPRERVVDWAATTFDELRRLAADEPDSGVLMRWGTELLREKQDDPWWRGAVPSFRRLAAPPDGFDDGWRFETPVVDMPTYLPWLAARVEGAGGRITRMALPALPNRAPLVVNCSGIAARSLVGDGTLSPVRGQVVYVAQVGLTEWLVEESDEALPTYVVPRPHDIVVGGTAQPGDWNRRPDPELATRILDRARALVPELAGATVLGHRVGLRPARPAVRLETEHTRDGGPVVHCYGHGGAGVTLSWGCADEVVEHVRALCPV